MEKIYIRDIKTREVVHTIDVHNKSPHQVERVVMGMLINIDKDKYFIDDSEALIDTKETKGGK